MANCVTFRTLTRGPDPGLRLGLGRLNHFELTRLPLYT